MTGDLVPFRRLPEKRKQAVEASGYRLVARPARPVVREPVVMRPLELSRVVDPAPPLGSSPRRVMLWLALLPVVAGLIAVTMIAPWVGPLLFGLLLVGVLLVIAVAYVRA